MTTVANLTTSIARVTSALGDVDEQLIKEFMQDAQDVLKHEYDWPFLQKTGEITVVSGTDTYDLPSDYDKMSKLYYIDHAGTYYVVDPISDPAFYTNIGYTAIHYGVPNCYRQVGENDGVETIQLGPTPNDNFISTYGSTLYVQYYRNPALISASTSPDWPSDFHSVLKWGTILLMAVSQSDQVLTQSSSTLYEQMKRKQEVKYRLRYRDTYKPVLGRNLTPTPSPRRALYEYGRKR